jgi:hypothetical protein
MKIAATASYSAVPSMFIVAPIGITNRTTLESISFFSSRQFIEIGRVALLKYKHTIVTTVFEHLCNEASWYKP